MFDSGFVLSLGLQALFFTACLLQWGVLAAAAGWLGLQYLRDLVLWRLWGLKAMAAIDRVFLFDSPTGWTHIIRKSCFKQLFSRHPHGPDELRRAQNSLPR